MLDAAASTARAPKAREIMHKKVVAGVAAMLFVLLSMVAWVFADLMDRSFPAAIESRAIVSMDFSRSDLDDREALSSLGALSDRYDLGMLRISPDLSGDQSAEVFVKVGRSGPSLDRVPRFGNQPSSRVLKQGSLTFSFADGSYLLTGSSRGDPELRHWMSQHTVLSTWEESGARQTIRFAFSEELFLVALLGVLSLMVSLVLYWLATKARGRALRVLAGVPARRIQYEDLGTFLWLVLLTAAAVGPAATAIVAATRGTAFIGYYASILGVFGIAVVVATLLVAMLIFRASWPSERALAARTPAAGSLRHVSKIVTTITFGLALVTVGPAMAAHAESAKTAAQQAKWRSLADQVLLDFPSGLGENGFQQVSPAVADVVADGERRGSVAMSYAVSPETVQLDGSGWDGYDYAAMVNPTWLTLMAPSDGESSGVSPLTKGQIPPALRRWLDDSISVWVPGRSPAAVKAWWDAARIYRYSEASGLTVSVGGSGDLVFPANALIIVLPSLHKVFDADFLASVASSRNLTFTGLEPTLNLLDRHGLRTQLQVRYLAEAGVLQAQLAAYTEWLKGASTIALCVAFVMASLVSALIGAMVSARRDFALRLGGRSWGYILMPRLFSEWVVGLGLLAGVLVAQRGNAVIPVLALVMAGALVTGATQFQASRWVFVNVSLRKL
jgi:hypothetical protein